jgi:hypothetical protein
MYYLKKLKKQNQIYLKAALTSHLNQVLNLLKKLQKVKQVIQVLKEVLFSHLLLLILQISFKIHKLVVVDKVKGLKKIILI